MSTRLARRESAVVTERETQVLRLVALGHTTPEIATKLALSSHTVQMHRRNGTRKIQATSRADVVAWAIESGRFG
jgi:DNA-binding CsgD family transcriptional regulator